VDHERAFGIVEPVEERTQRVGHRPNTVFRVQKRSPPTPRSSDRRLRSRLRPCECCCGVSRGIRATTPDLRTRRSTAFQA
jgi:hypothetical protein